MNLDIKQLATASLIVASGCASVQTRTVDQDDMILSSHKETRRLRTVMADVQQDGTNLSLTAHKACRVQWMQNVQRTTVTENYNATPEVDYLLGVFGAAAVVTGAVMVVDAKNMYPNDENSRQYNPHTQGEAQLGGGVLIGTGSVMMLIPIVDAARASGEETTVTEHTNPGDVVKKKTPCRNGAVAGAEVKGRVNGNKFSMGETDEDGALSFDLSRIPLDVVGDAETIEIAIGGKTVGKASAEPIRARRDAAIEERAFARAKSCEDPQTSSDCEAASEYLQRFPEGKHADEVKMMRRRAQRRLAELKDEEAWRYANTECSHGTEVCLLNYKSAFPEGAHVEEAEERLEEIKRKERQQNCAARCANLCGTDRGCIKECRKREAPCR